ncbi:hypothetical protein, partial [Serratia sp. CY60161]|uniref:hypothetical protein n=1 Tax=Serratia sp. CY60161 TaxID=3383647 RepID=UPI003FA187A7
EGRQIACRYQALSSALNLRLRRQGRRSGGPHAGPFRCNQTETGKISTFSGISLRAHRFYHQCSLGGRPV